MSVAVYPGSFDPITNGHLDIVERAAAVFDTVVVAVLANPRKAPLLSVEQRIDVIRTALAAHSVPDDRVDVASFDGLTVEFARARGASAIVRLFSSGCRITARRDRSPSTRYLALLHGPRCQYL